MADEEVVKLLQEIRDLQKMHVENYKDALKKPATINRDAKEGESLATDRAVSLDYHRIRGDGDRCTAFPVQPIKMPTHAGAANSTEVCQRHSPLRAFDSRTSNGV